LPAQVWRLECGGLVNAIGGGFVLPFALIYFHDVRGFSLGASGLMLATLSAVQVVAAPAGGALVDRFSAWSVLIASLLAIAYALFAVARAPWQAFAVAALAGVGNGIFNPAQSSLLGLLVAPEQRHIAFSLQRTMTNLGFGVGGLIGGVVATTSSPATFEALFVANAISYMLFIVVLIVFVGRPAVRDGGEPARAAVGGRYAAVLRDRAFMGLLALNATLCTFGFAMFQEIVPIYAKDFARVSESEIGAFFLVNTALIVVLQLPTARALEGRRRIRAIQLVAAGWAVGLLIVLIGGNALTGTAAAAVIAIAVVLWSAGECIQGALINPMAVDLAPEAMLGRYLALASVSWQIGFAAAPALSGFALRASPTATWLVAAAMCALAGTAASLLERRLPAATRRTPVPPGALAATETG